MFYDRQLRIRRSCRRPQDRRHELTPARRIIQHRRGRLISNERSSWDLAAFLRHEAAGGYVLIAAAAAALLVANSPLASAYFAVLETEVGLGSGPLHLSESVRHWVNDGLMSLFFLLVGLEIKREVLVGQFAGASRIVLPTVAALGGVLAPAAVYLLIAGRGATAAGWAIPSATDIAFALGVLALLGRRVPPSLKLFLTAVAIVDDLVAIAIIALFYTAQLHLGFLAAAAAVLAAVVGLNLAKVRTLWPYLLAGAALWYLVLRSGVHATLAGVALAMATPLGGGGRETRNSPLRRLEHALHGPVAFGVTPIFGFANAGVSFAGGAAVLLNPVSIGVAAGLFLGKQLGILAGAGVAVRLGWSTRPAGTSLAQLYGVAVLCGIGFTMSLFIGGLAFDDPALIDATKAGVFAGSVLSALLGALILALAHRNSRGRPGQPSPQVTREPRPRQCKHRKTRRA